MKFKKALIAIMSLSCLSCVSTLNASAVYKNYSFSLDADYADGVGYSLVNQTAYDNTDYATVAVTSGNLNNNKRFYMCVCKNYCDYSSYKNTDWVRFQSNSQIEYMDYYSSRDEGDNNFLCGDSDLGSVTVYGYWYS